MVNVGPLQGPDKLRLLVKRFGSDFFYGFDGMTGRFPTLPAIFRRQSGDRKAALPSGWPEAQRTGLPREILPPWLWAIPVPATITPVTITAMIIIDRKWRRGVYRIMVSSDFLS
jgi:hypothetical protein